MSRAFGRLTHISKDPDIGLVAAYVHVPGVSPTSGPSFWHPEARPAVFNRAASASTLEKIAKVFDANADYFLDNPRFDPD